VFTLQSSLTVGNPVSGTDTEGRIQALLVPRALIAGGHIDLSGRGLGNKGCLEVAQFLSSKDGGRVNSIDLEDNGITDEGAASLEAVLEGMLKKGVALERNLTAAAEVRLSLNAHKWEALRLSPNKSVEAISLGGNEITELLRTRIDVLLNLRRTERAQKSFQASGMAGKLFRGKSP